MRRLCVVVDVDGYSAHRNLVQLRIQERLAELLRSALAAAGVERRRTDRQDRGDGWLLILPPGADEARAVPGLLRGLLLALGSDHEEPRIRVRVALGQGIVHRAATGYVGRVVVEVCRMVDAQEVRSELRAAVDADMCLIVTDDLYLDVLAQGYGGFPAGGYRQVHVRGEKGFAATAWLQAMSVAAVGPETPGLGAMAVALPFFAAGALLSASTVDVAADDELVVPSDDEEDDHPEPDIEWS